MGRSKQGCMSEMSDRDPRFTRELDESEQESVERARLKAFILYEGKQVAHRSCGIALAETFGLEPAPYQALRRGGITGAGECGAIQAGLLILGQLLGDPDPSGKLTDVLRGAAVEYRREWQRRVDRGSGGAGGSIVCNDLTSPFDDFQGPERQQFCTNIAADVASIVAS